MSKEKSCKILQIIPADGWVANFFDPESNKEAQHDIVCFALIDDEGARRVEPMWWDIARYDIHFCGDEVEFESISKKQ